MESPEKLAENEATFRGANEAIQRRAQELEFDEPIPFICECGNGRCREIMQLSCAEYEAVRADPAHFFVVPGHETVAGSSGTVVRRNERFLVVEKIGVAGEVATELDPRTPAE